MKSKLLDEMVKYRSYSITGQLGYTFCYLVSKRVSPEVEAASPTLDALASYYPDRHTIVYGFYNRLEKSGGFYTTQPTST